MHKKVAAGVLFVLALAWIAWPFHTAYVVLVAAATRDIPTLERKVNWVAVRQGIKEDAVASMIPSGGGNSVIGSMIARKVAPSNVDPRIEQMVNKLVTPEMFASLARHAGIVNWEEDGTTDRRINRGRIKWAFLSGPMSFKVELAARNGPTVTLEFEWSGTWKLQRIVVPFREAKGYAAHVDLQI